MQCFKKHFAFSTVGSENSCFKTTVRKACFLLCTATSCGFDSRYFQMRRMYCRPKSRLAVQMRFFLLPTAKATVANSKNKKCTVSTWCIEKRLWINESVSSQPHSDGDLADGGWYAVTQMTYGVTPVICGFFRIISTSFFRKATPYRIMFLIPWKVMSVS